MKVLICIVFEDVGSQMITRLLVKGGSDVKVLITRWRMPGGEGILV